MVSGVVLMYICSVVDIRTHGVEKIVELVQSC